MYSRSNKLYIYLQIIRTRSLLKIKIKISLDSARGNKNRVLNDASFRWHANQLFKKIK